MNDKINNIRILSDISEGDLHVHAKNKITFDLLKRNLIFTNHKNITKNTNPDEIKEIIQEFTWYEDLGRGKPRKSFSADIAVFNHLGELEIIIEIVNTHRLHNRKFSFYENLDIFWIEIDAQYALLENDSFLTTYKYDNMNSFSFGNIKFLTEYEYVDLSTPIKKKRKNRKFSKDKIKRLKKINEINDIIKLLLKEKKSIVNDDLSNTKLIINQDLKTLRKLKKNIKIEHLSKSEKKQQIKNKKEQTKQTKIRKRIKKIKDKTLIMLVNNLENIYKNTKNTKVDFNIIYQQLYNYPTIFQLNDQKIKTLSKLGWDIDIDLKIFKRNF